MATSSIFQSMSSRYRRLLTVSRPLAGAPQSFVTKNMAMARAHGAGPRPLVHDRGRVLADLACAIADGGEAISDFRVIGDQGELFGLAASVPTVWRTLGG